jgi:hypothetical protein
MQQDEISPQDIIEMARQAGATEIGHKPPAFHFYLKDLEAFAKLVRNDYSNKHAQLWLKRIDEAVKAEREACAKLCEMKYPSFEDGLPEYRYNTIAKAAAAIRARGEA